METTTLDGDSPKRKHLFLSYQESIVKPKLLYIELSNSVINNPPSATSCADKINFSLSGLKLFAVIHTQHLNQRMVLMIHYYYELIQDIRTANIIMRFSN